jgi:hypothetical protein
MDVDQPDWPGSMYRSEYRAGPRMDLSLRSTLPCGTSIEDFCVCGEGMRDEEVKERKRIRKGIITARGEGR